MYFKNILIDLLANQSDIVDTSTGLAIRIPGLNPTLEMTASYVTDPVQVTEPQVPEFGFSFPKLSLK